jgi:hypothetical protein
MTETRSIHEHAKELRAKKEERDRLKKLADVAEAEFKEEQEALFGRFEDEGIEGLKVDE